MSLFLVLAALSASDVALMPLDSRRVDPDVVQILDDLLTEQVALAHPARVISARELATLLDAEQMKDALGCDETRCAAEIAGALGTRYLITGSVSRLGSKLIVQLVMIDSESIEVLARSNSSIDDDEDRYGRAVKDAVKKLFRQVPSTSSPREQSRATPGSLIRLTAESPGIQFKAFAISEGRVARQCENGFSSIQACELHDLPDKVAEVVVQADDHYTKRQPVTLALSEPTVGYVARSEITFRQLGLYGVSAASPIAAAIALAAVDGSDGIRLAAGSLVGGA
ncbi:MAG: hypothetical protein AAFX94_08045, partial [Myxococcota bacterium]